MRWSLLLMVAVSFLFVLWPELDLLASHLFYDPVQGGFIPKEAPPGSWLYRVIPWFTKAVICFALGCWLVIALKKRPIAGLTRRKAAFLLLALVLGPGSVVNVVFKDHWGRARPHQIEQFGGEADFTPAWVISDACERNCSFMSGHAATAFFIMLLGFVWPKHRMFWLASGVAFGLLIGLTRMVQGGHFLSDVLLAGLTVYLIGSVLASLLLRKELELQSQS